MKRLIFFLILSLALPAGATTLTSLQKGLIAHWPLNSASYNGTVFQDATPYDNHGTPSGDLVTNATSSYAEFDGNGDKITLPDTIIGMGDTSVSFWLYWQGSGNSAFEHLFNNGEFRVMINDASPDILYVESHASSPSFACYTTMVALNTWIHVLITIDADGADYIYFNGVVVNTGYTNSGAPTAGIYNLIIGDDSDGTNNFDGYLSDLRIYNRILSTAEIASLASVAPSAGMWKMTINPAYTTTISP